MLLPVGELFSIRKRCTVWEKSYGAAANGVLQSGEQVVFIGPEFLQAGNSQVRCLTRLGLGWIHLEFIAYHER